MWYMVEVAWSYMVLLCVMPRSDQTRWRRWTPQVSIQSQCKWRNDTRCRFGRRDLGDKRHAMKRPSHHCVCRLKLKNLNFSSDIAWRCAATSNQRWSPTRHRRSYVRHVTDVVTPGAHCWKWRTSLSLRCAASRNFMIPHHTFTGTATKKMLPGWRSATRYSFPVSCEYLACLQLSDVTLEHVSNG